MKVIGGILDMLGKLAIIVVIGASIAWVIIEAIKQGVR